MIKPLPHSDGTSIEALADRPPASPVESRNGTELARESLESFIHNPGLASIASLFGVEELPEDTNERLSTLQELATSHWYIRKGEERFDVDWDNALLDDEKSEPRKIIFSAADQLGLVSDTKPHNRNPDSLVILGGANRAPLDRLRYGIENVDDFSQVVYLGSSREVSDGEREKAKSYAPNAQTEFDLGCGAFETLLEAKFEDETEIVKDSDTWKMRLYSFKLNGKLRRGFVLSTPREIGERRATTYDNYRFLVECAEIDKDPDHSIVAVTTGFYTAGQHLPGIQETTLPYGTKLETIGHSAEYSGVIRKPTQLLQEIKSAVDAAARLQQAIDAKA